MIVNDVLEAFERIGGYTILVKGSPGTGKTTFAVTLLEEICLKGGGKGVYISTRVDPETFYKQFPRISKFIPADNILDATQSEFVEDKSRQLRYEDLASFLRAVFTKVEEKDVSILIVDSWDAICSQIGDDIEKLNVSMLDVARKTETNLILISEKESEDKLDYLVDCILLFKQEREEERLVRRVFIQKMRGVPIKEQMNLFTLHDGRFTHVTSNIAIVKAKKEKIPNKDEFFSSGIKGLDDILGGGYPRGAFVLLEAAKESVGLESYWQIVLQTVVNFLHNDMGVLVIPEEGLDTKFVKESVANYVAEDKIDEHVRVIDADVSEGISAHFNAYLDEYNKFKSRNKHCLHVIGLTKMNFFDENDVRIHLSDLVVRNHHNKDLMIGIMKPSTVLSGEIKEMADIYLKVTQIEGVICMYGVKPRTCIYGLSQERSGEFLEIKLTPIV